MPLVNTNRTAAQDRKERTNDLYSRTQSRVGGWHSTPSGLKAGTVEIVAAGGSETIRVSSKTMLSSATAAEAINDSETGIDVSDGTAFQVGQTIKIDGENMYIQSISSNTLTVRRETDGTDADTHDNGSSIYVLNPKTPDRYSELGSETLKFIKGGSSFNYPKQMQFIPASALNFGSAFDFTDNNLVDYDNDQYDVMFILKDMQTYSVTSTDENSAQYLQVSAEDKTSTGFTPTANIYVGSVLSSSTVTSFDDSSAAFGSLLSTPAYDTAKTSNDAYDDQATASVVSLSATFTLTFSSVVDKGGDLFVEGYVRAGTSDGSNAFNSSNYEQQSFSEIRDPGFGDGTVTMTKNFTFGGALGNPARVVLTITNFASLGSSTASLAGALTSITYTTSSGTTRSITGANRADAIVIAR
jgi:hypothetical protein|tara:strand:+ start:53 stop:1291 length:1239 start_codon:yes stop_codon:yes gene_type:complete